MSKDCVRFKKLEDLHRGVHVRVGAHGQLPGGRNAPGQDKVPTMQEKRTDPSISQP
jgi:hypothetical protein